MILVRSLKEQWGAHNNDKRINKRKSLDLCECDNTKPLKKRLRSSQKDHEANVTDSSQSVGGNTEESISVPYTRCSKIDPNQIR